MGQDVKSALEIRSLLALEFCTERRAPVPELCANAWMLDAGQHEVNHSKDTASLE